MVIVSLRGGAEAIYGTKLIGCVMEKKGYVYIMSNPRRTVLYTGVTSDLEKRVYQHKHKLIAGFTERYNCVDLLWWTESESMASAIAEEKRIKGGSRAKKEAWILEMNPGRVDLAKVLFGH
jgi:putative endonuclease